MTSLVAEAKRLYGNARMTSLNVETLSAPLARATYRYDVPALDQQSEPWVNEGGQWKDDDC